ncbi:MAG: hypothetical protein RQ743_03785 [Bacteroidales bacterium]|nr:hypothetical protein [Bacteroidales bacterium]
MKQKKGILYLSGFILIAVLMASCDKDAESVYAGEFTIDNTLYGPGPYYAIGFSFDKGQKVQTDAVPGPDITVHARTDIQGAVSGAYLDTPNLLPSFALAGDFATGTEAKTFFDELLAIGSYSWTLFADDISEHQVYVFKTRKENYVKFRIKNLVLNDTGDGPFAEITIEWRIQADGSTTFSQ